MAGALTPILYCHATRCRKATGGAFSPETLAGRDGFRWLRGESLITVYEAPLLRERPPYRRAFCSRCGSPLPIAIEGTPFMVLIAGVLDDDPQTRPFRHAFAAQKACWHQITDTLPRFEGQPDPPPPGWTGSAPLTDEQIAAAHVGAPTVHNGPIELAEPDPRWPELFAREAERIRRALGRRVLLLEHIGSTSVPGLAAKPIIDVCLAVADSSDEAAYVPALESQGYVLRIREPQWNEHRCFKGPDTDVRLHVFSARCPEIERCLCFRDRLRASPADRALYERTKRELAARTWKYVQNYADAKASVVEEIIDRARRLDAEPS